MEKYLIYELYKNHVHDNICIDWVNSAHKNPHIDYDFDLRFRIPLKEQQFDTILVTDVLEHIPNPDTLWQEISRLLKGYGKVIVGVPFFYPLHEQPHDYFRYTEYSLRMFCERNGLKIISLEAYGGGLETLLNLLAKSLGSRKFVSGLFLHFAQLTTSIYRRIKPIGKNKQNFPLGYCLVAQKI